MEMPRVWFRKDGEFYEEEAECGPESPSDPASEAPVVFVDEFADGDEDTDLPPPMLRNPTISRKLKSFESFVVGKESSRAGRRLVELGGASRRWV